MRTTFLLACVMAGSTLPMAAQLPTGEALLVTPAWLAEHTQDRDLVILHVGREDGYAREHIAGALPVDGNDFASDAMPMLEMLPEAKLRSNLERYGIGDATRIVVVFGSGSVADATRIFLTLGYAGLGEQARFLDGGLVAWKRAGNAVTATPARAQTPGHLTRKMLPGVVVDYQAVGAIRKGSQPRLVDARAAVFYSGPKTEMMAQGHIPGAVNIPFSSLITDDERLLPRAALLARFHAAGIEPGDSLVVYCHVGQQATVVLLAARILGHQVQLYDGSFHDWSNRKLPTDNAPAAVSGR